MQGELNTAKYADGGYHMEAEPRINSRVCRLVFSFEMRQLLQAYTQPRTKS